MFGADLVFDRASNMEQEKCDGELAEEVVAGADRAAGCVCFQALDEGHVGPRDQFKQDNRDVELGADRAIEPARER